MPVSPCTHEHIWECYKYTEKCRHKHTEECYPEDDDIASASSYKKAIPSECIHECSIEEGCIKEILDCKHKHDESCGYAAPVRGTPCNFECTICRMQGSTVPSNNALNTNQKFKDGEQKPLTEKTMTDQDQLENKVMIQIKTKGGSTEDEILDGEQTDIGATHTLTVTPNGEKQVIAGYFSKDNLENFPEEQEYKNMKLQKITDADENGAVKFQFTATEYIPDNNNQRYKGYIYVFFYCEKLPEKRWPFDEVTGEATAPSSSVANDAAPYVSNNKLSGESGSYYGITDTYLEKYLEWTVISKTDSSGQTASGTVSFENNQFKYTPGYSDAGKKITIKIRPDAGYAKGKILSFVIDVKKNQTAVTEYLVMTKVKGYGGTVMASPAKAAAGKKIQLYFRISDPDYHLEKLETVPAGIAISSDNSFNMPSQNVEIQAYFDKHKYTSNGDDTHSCLCNPDKTEESCSYDSNGVCTVCGYVDVKVIEHPKNITVDEGKSASFEIAAKGENVSYQWFLRKNGSVEKIAGAVGKSYTIQNVAIEMSGNQYYCVVSNNTGDEAVSTDAFLTVNELQDSNTPSGGTSSGGGSVSNAGVNYEDGRDKKQAEASYGTWIKDEQGWWYQRKDGSYPKSQWEICFWNGKKDWYHFDDRGYMQTGWFKDTFGQKYYLHSVSDGRQGYMYTGWHLIDGMWYYFCDIKDSTEGILYINRHTPDGYRVDENGIWKP